MRKYICNACGIRICTAEYQSGSGIPMKCTALIDRYCKAAWQEVKGEERPAKALPDWCKVEEWLYYPEDMGHGVYLKISEIKNGVVYAKEKDDYDPWQISYKHIREYAKPARKRPFNAKEMQGLVGKVLKHNTGNYLVTAFENRWNQVKIESVWRDSEELKELWTQLDGKPCYVLEHLENGEWVE